MRVGNAYISETSKRNAKLKMKDKFEELYSELPNLLSKLNADLKPKWGTMHVLQMVNHLATGFELSASYQEYKITTPEEKIPAFQRFLMSDKPFPHHSKMPQNYVDFPAIESNDLESAKARFLEKVRLLKEATENDTDFWSVHENFGKLNAEQTRQLHFKHITHHLTQFGVIS